jgi:hypothetical protein
MRNWLGGRSFEEAVARSYRAASLALGLVWRANDGQIHPKIESSRMLVFGDGDLRIG